MSRAMPAGPVKETLKSYYYRFYYNAKHFQENGFHVYYRNGHFEYKFEDNTTFSSYENFADELKRSLNGYLAKRRLRPEDAVVDCGAFLGEFTLYAAAAVGSKGNVIAFEPDPLIFKKLTANIALNGFNNIKAVNKGVWNKEGLLKFVGDSIKGYSFMSASLDKDAIEVPVVSLDAELARLGTEKVDFIKMDVEGAEIEAVKGAENTLKNNNASLAIASYHTIGGRKSCVELEKVLATLGYSSETAHPQHLTTYAKK
jgi:FkbM family methyltransferase